MSIEIKVPPLPESVADATLVAWHKKEGDAVSRDENLVDLETDKVVLEVPAPSSGTLQEIRITDGTTVTSGQVLAILLEGEGTQTAANAEPQAKTPPETEITEAPAAASSASALKLSPSVRRLLDEHDLDATIVMGTGKGGRVTREK
jgi:2-oxoglutarate dehydrogenase E2 component (dihydrolipoamide succinyltransferase)